MTRLADLQVESSERGRSTWLFQYSSKELKEACEKVAGYHEKRENFYTGQAEGIEATLREKGVSLEEQSVTGGAQFIAKVDPILGQQLSTARSKRDSHRRDKEIYDAYAGAFSKINLSYYLTIGDVVFFSLHREPGE